MKRRSVSTLVFCLFLGLGAAQANLDEASTPLRNETEDTTSKVPHEIFTIEENAERFEKLLKGFIKQGVKSLMPRVLSSMEQGSLISPKCAKAYMKFIGDLSKAKVWALKMVDASSKLPPGVLDGTFTDYGSFDECLEIAVPLRNGGEDFRGQYCAVEATPHLPPTPRNLSLARQLRAKPHDTIATEFKLSSTSFHYLQFRLGVCVPSSCTIDDIRKMAGVVMNPSVTKVHIQKCYVKEGFHLQPIHITVISVFAVLLIVALVGTTVEAFRGESRNNDSGVWRILAAFSLGSNSKKLFATSKSNGEMKALHGIRALSMAWVILGHTYVWTSFNRVRRLSNMQVWFNSIEFEAILNGWLSVEMFFFLSGLLTCYAALQMMEKAKGKLNVPFFIIHRYLRLTPSLLLAMGLLFFLPLISSGPFWHERVDPEIEACKKYWWTNLIYIANWTSMKKICMHPTWYLSADFQMFIVSLVVLIILYRSSVYGLLSLAALTTGCTIVTGVLTYVWDLPPAILIATGHTRRIEDEIDLIHIRTFAHAGPYCIGMATGYLILKKRKLKFTKLQQLFGWSASITLCLSSVYGLHRWSTGYFHGQFVSSLYAAMHRTTFTMGAAWVAIACVTGHGGPVNRILSCSIWAPFSKLTYVAYLMHSLVIWTRYGSIRERFYLWHYNMLYEYIGNVVLVVVVSLPFYLLVEAPLSNLERMIFSRGRPSEENRDKPQQNHLEVVSSPPESHMDLKSPDG